MRLRYWGQNLRRMKRTKLGVVRGPGRRKSLSQLAPTDFENLIFDLLVLGGMKNVNWRTPGADGGRDIEGFTAELDLSGRQQIKKWFVECKRYARSVDWPTIYHKIAYADSNQADVLLMCTTSSFSPAAITEVDKWNNSRRAMSVRLWPRHELEIQLKHYPDSSFEVRNGGSAIDPRSVLCGHGGGDG